MLVQRGSIEGDRCSGGDRSGVVTVMLQLSAVFGNECGTWCGGGYRGLGCAGEPVRVGTDCTVYMNSL